jgi:hypothetical protein
MHKIVIALATLFVAFLFNANWMTLLMVAALIATLLPALRRAPSLLWGLVPTVPFRPLSAHRRRQGQ